MFLATWIVISAIIALLIFTEDVKRSIDPKWRIILIFFWPIVAVIGIIFCVVAIILGLLSEIVEGE